MDDNNNDAKRGRASTRSPSMRTPVGAHSGDNSSDRSRSEHSIELTLPPKKSAKHYNRKTAKNPTTPIPVIANNGHAGRAGDSTSDKENFCDREKVY